MNIKSLLATTFSKQTWLRGLSLFELGTVIECTRKKNEIIGLVVDEKDAYSEYYLTISLSKNSAYTDCSCSANTTCKHSAALAHAYLNSLGPSSDTNSKIEQWLNNINSPIDLPSQAEGFLYFLNVEKYLASERLNVDIKSGKRRKNGSWSSSLHYEHLTLELLKKSYADDADIQIISNLLKRDLYRNQGLKSSQILQKIINTGRCFWQESYELNKPITASNHRIASWQWQALQDSNYNLDLLFNESEKHSKCLPTSPLNYYDGKTNSIGLVQTNLSDKLNHQLLVSPIISETQLPWVISQINYKLGAEADKLTPPKARSLQQIKQPIPILSISTPNENIPELGVINLRFAYPELNVNPLYDSPIIKKVNNKNENLYRDTSFERTVIGKLQDLHFIASQQQSHFLEDTMCLELKNQNHWLKFLHEECPKLQGINWKISFENNFYYQIQQSEGNFQAKFEAYDNDYFSLALNLDIDGQSLPALPIIQSAIQQLPKEWLNNNQVIDEHADTIIYIHREQGQYLPLPFKKIHSLISQFIELSIPDILEKNGQLLVSKFSSKQALKHLEKQEITSKGTTALKQLAYNLDEFDKIKTVKPPSTFKASLRGYQQQGVNWLQFLRKNKLNGILADDMGLGKTIQTIAHLCIEQHKGRLNRPSLIIAPTSVIFNWASELKKFSPHLKTLILHGSSREKSQQQLESYDILITSYALISKDLDLHQSIDYQYLILDEAQYIKNHKTKLYTAITTLNGEHKLCLTGTPMENHIGEIWSQFNFLLPSFLGSYELFNRLYKIPIEKNADQHRKASFSERIKPFILRRTKENIAKDLPAKTEIIQTIRIEGKQAELYESVRLSMDSKLNQIIADKGINRSHIEILDALLKLRQVCCHPQLLPLDSAKKVKHSAKLDLLMEMLPSLIAEGRKVLIFSQFTSMLSLIEEALNKVSITYLKLTGASTKRQELVESFQQGLAPVFLISLKAGGVGLNLTQADTVIHFDPWWNPAVENQATDRAHRIGQKNPVFVYKFIVENSIEEKIQQLQAEKSKMAASLLHEEINDTNISLNKDILKSLLSPLNDI